MPYSAKLAGVALDSTTGELLEYLHLIKHPIYKAVWGSASGKEVGRLFQGLLGVIEGTDTLCFIAKTQIPKEQMKDEAHVRIVCNKRPEKEDPKRVRIAAAGKVNYLGDCGTPIADLLTMKLLLNSVISTPDEKFFTMDIANSYLNTPFKRKSTCDSS